MSAEGMVQIFRRILETEEVDSNSDFFTVGGDSLLATRVLSAVAKEYGTELSFAEFVNAPTPRGLSERVLRSGS